MPNVRTARKYNGAYAYDIDSTGRSQTSPLHVSSVAYMRTMPVPQTGTDIGPAIITCTGYYTDGDGAGGRFRWDPTSSAADDGGSAILPTGYTGAGRWKRIFETSIISVKLFGAKGDWNGSTGTDDTAAIQAAATYINAQQLNMIGVIGAGMEGMYTLFFPNGYYRITTTIEINNYITVSGDGCATLSAPSTVNILRMPCAFNRVEFLTFSGGLDQIVAYGNFVTFGGAAGSPTFGAPNRISDCQFRGAAGFAFAQDSTFWRPDINVDQRRGSSAHLIFERCEFYTTCVYWGSFDGCAFNECYVTTDFINLSYPLDTFGRPLSIWNSNDNLILTGVLFVPNLPGGVYPSIIQGTGGITAHTCRFGGETQINVVRIRPNQMAFTGPGAPQTWTGGTVNNGAAVSVDITVNNFTNVADPTHLAYATCYPALPAGCTIDATVAVAGTIHVTVTNNSGGPVTPTHVSAWTQLRSAIARARVNGSASWTIGSDIGAGATVTTDVPVTGATTNDSCGAKTSVTMPAGLVIDAGCRVGGTVRVNITNTTGSPIAMNAHAAFTVTAYAGSPIAWGQQINDAVIALKNCTLLTGTSNLVECYGYLPALLQVEGTRSGSASGNYRAHDYQQMSNSLGVWIDSTTISKTEILSRNKTAMLFQLNDMPLGFRVRYSADPTVQTGAEDLTHIFRHYVHQENPWGANSQYPGDQKTQLNLAGSLFDWDSMSFTYQAPNIAQSGTVSFDSFTVKNWLTSAADTYFHVGYLNGWGAAGAYPEGEYCFSFYWTSSYSGQLTLGTNSNQQMALRCFQKSSDFNRVWYPFYHDGVTGKIFDVQTYNMPNAATFSLCGIQINKGNTPSPYLRAGNPTVTQRAARTYRINGAAVPASGTYEVGDIILRDDATSGQAYMSICTTRGAVGVAVFKTAITLP